MEQPRIVRTTRRTVLAGITAALAPVMLAARAQPRHGASRRLGVLSATAATDPMAQVNAAAFVQALGVLNWHEDDNLRIDWRWAGGDPALFERYAAELVALAPDVPRPWARRV